MNRGIQFAAVVVVFVVTAPCMATNKTASATPTIAGKQVAKGGPIFSSQPPTNSAKCAVGATNEPLWSYSPPEMTSETTGWGIGLCTLSAKPSFPNGSTINCYAAEGDWMGILRTTDGGSSWTDVSPPSLTNRTWHHAQFFLDASHAWVTEVSRTADACASQATTFMTSDGGRTWQQGGSIALKLSAPEDDVFNVSGPVNNMDFIDPQHGWLTVVSAPSHPNGGPGDITMLTVVYSTSDGGMHWRLTATNPGQSLLSASGCPTTFYAPVSDVSFVSDTFGWFAIACTPGLMMLATRDGGATWSARPLPSCTCQVYRPTVLDADHVVVTGVQGSPVMLTTADGGSTWSQRRVPQAALTAFSFTNPDHGWMVGIAQLPTTYETVVYRTTDGGQSWTLVGKPGFTVVGSNPNAYFPITGVQFVNQSVGFAFLGVEAGHNGQTDPTAPTLQILKTNDAGRTWNVVLKQMPATPCVANYRTIGFGNGQLSPAKMASATVGWARGGLRTTDGGAHWRDVSSPALREGSSTALYPPGYTEFYLDGDHAWQAAVYGSNTSCADHVSTFATSDGGKTWQQSRPIVLNLPAGHQAGSMQVGFASPQSGWLWIPNASTQSSDPLDFRAMDAALYVTSDGGLTWSHASSITSAQLRQFPVPTDSQNCQPSLGQVTFSSSSVGWLSLNCTQTSTLVSRDGGATWKAASFPVPSSMSCPCYVELPQFVDESHGFVSVSGQNGLTGSNVLLTTADGGTTWRPSGQPGTGFVLLLAFVDPNDVFALVTPPGWTKLSPNGFELYRSGDAGSSWTLVQPKVPATWPPGFLQFVDLNHGFESNTNGADQLLLTADGGKTWRSITPAIDT
jgi:photosystem II stability/assembly factor-like uncharacterized protein